jgi:hypothetical protein
MNADLIELPKLGCVKASIQRDPVAYRFVQGSMSSIVAKKRWVNPNAANRDCIRTPLVIVNP